MMGVCREGPTPPGIDELVGEDGPQVISNQQNLITSVPSLDRCARSVEPRKTRDWSLEATVAPEEAERLPGQQLC